MKGWCLPPKAESAPEVRVVIELYSVDTRIIKLVRDAAAGLTDFQVHAPRRPDLPKRFEFVATAGQLNAGVERFAAQYGALVVVMPEGGFYLATKARERGHVSVLGSDYRDVKI